MHAEGERLARFGTTDREVEPCSAAILKRCALTISPSPEDEFGIGVWKRLNTRRIARVEG